MRGVARDPRWGVPQRGADGPARRFGFVSPAWWTGPPPIHSPRTNAPQQDGQAGKSRLLARSRLRILVQSLRTKAERAQGWAGHPGHSCRMRLTSPRTPDPDVDAPHAVTHWSNPNLCLSSDSSVLE